MRVHLLHGDLPAKKSRDEVQKSIEHLREVFELEGRLPDGRTKGLEIGVK